VKKLREINVEAKQKTHAGAKKEIGIEKQCFATKIYSRGVGE